MVEHTDERERGLTRRLESDNGVVGVVRQLPQANFQLRNTNVIRHGNEYVLADSTVRHVGLRDVDPEMDDFIRQYNGEDDVVIGKYWEICKMCENICTTIRDHPSRTPTGILIRGHENEYSEKTTLILSQLSQYAPTKLKANKKEVAMSVANAIGSLTVLYEALEPLIKQNPQVREKLDSAMEGLNRMVTVGNVKSKQYSGKHFQDGVPGNNQILEMVRTSISFKACLRMWWQRMITQMGNVIGVQFETRQSLENADFRL